MRTISEVLIGVGLVTTLLCACEERDITVPQELQPTGTDAVVNSEIYGDPDLVTSVFELARSASGTYSVSGTYDGVDFIGLLDENGKPTRTDPETFEVRDLLQVPGGVGQQPSVMVAVGWQKPGDDFEGVVAAYDGGGSKFGELVIETAMVDVWLNEAIVVSTAPTQVDLVAVGGTRVQGNQAPFLIRLSLAADGTLTSRGGKTFTEIPGAYFGEVQVDESDNVFATGGTPGDGVDDAYAWGMTPVLDVIWGTSLSTEGASLPSVTALQLSNGSLYAVGRFQVEKNGQTWSSGLVASLARDGEVRWLRNLVLSEASDRYTDCVIDGDHVYAVGVFSSFEWIDTKRRYGYALVSRFDAPTGETDYHLSFGGDQFSSAFNTTQLAGQTLVCGGSTNHFMTGFGLQGWFVEIDVGNVGGSSLARSHGALGAAHAPPTDREGPSR